MHIKHTLSYGDYIDYTYLNSKSIDRMLSMGNALLGEMVIVIMLCVYMYVHSQILHSIICIIVNIIFLLFLVMYISYAGYTLFSTRFVLYWTEAISSV